MSSLHRLKMKPVLVVTITVVAAVYLSLSVIKSSFNSTFESEIGVYPKGLHEVINPERDSFDYGILQAMATIRIEQAMNEYKSPPFNVSLNLNDTPSGWLSSKKPILIISTWRSGSSFLGELINSFPGSFYSYEPLDYLKNRPNESKAELIDSIFNCHFPDKYLKIMNCIPIDGRKDEGCFMYRNWRLWAACRHDPSLCYNTDFVRRICSFSPIRLTKVVRMRIREFEPFLLSQSEMLDWKIVYLIRDPRGIMSSRKETTWCNQIETCADPKTLCADLEDDLNRIERLNNKYPDLIKVIQFENFTANIQEDTVKLFEFLELPLTRSVLTYLNTHTDSDRENNNYLATFRHTKDVATKWKSKLSQENVTLITDMCLPLLEKLHLHE